MGDPAVHAKRIHGMIKLGMGLTRRMTPLTLMLLVMTQRCLLLRVTLRMHPEWRKLTKPKTQLNYKTLISTFNFKGRPPASGSATTRTAESRWLEVPTLTPPPPRPPSGLRDEVEGDEGGLSAVSIALVSSP